jgi:hypothetical protein
MRVAREGLERNGRGSRSQRGLRRGNGGGSGLRRWAQGFGDADEVLQAQVPLANESCRQLGHLLL